MGALHYLVKSWHAWGPIRELLKSSHSQPNNNFNYSNLEKLHTLDISSLTFYEMFCFISLKVCILLKHTYIRNML